MTELKPCPFCGGKAEIHTPRQKGSRATREEFLPSYAQITRRMKDGTIIYIIPGYTPRCCNSSCAGRLGKRWLTEEEAVEAWNRRAGELE